MSTDGEDTAAKKSEGVKIVSKQNTLMTAFQKQRDNEPAAKPPASKTPKASKRSNTPTNLKSMFEKQLSGASSSNGTAENSSKGSGQHEKQNLHPNADHMDVDSKPSDSCNQTVASTQDMAATSSELHSTLNPTTHSFKRSPFESYAFSPEEEPPGTAQPAVAIASASAINQQHAAQGSSEADEHLCVVCEDDKKQVVLLPCKHMCLCKACADFEKIKECPMCRTKIEDSMTVFI